MRYTLSCLAAAALLLTVSPARAGLTFDFQDTGTGDKGTTRVFSANIAGSYNDPYHITATAGPIATPPATNDLYVKHGGGTENGLGLTSDASGEHEITSPNYINFNIGGLKTVYGIQTFVFALGSISGSDSYEVDAINANGTVGKVLGTNLTAATFDVSAYVKTYDTFRIAGNGGNVLVDAATVPRAGRSSAAQPRPRRFP